MSFEPVGPAKSQLARYRQLAPSAAVKVSPLCLGAMNFGEGWASRLGECSKETTFQILDYYYENGGNFIDTANNYQNEDSEKWVGEWMEARGVRDQIVLATKYASPYRKYVAENGSNEIQANYVGHNAKALRVSVQDSLRKLKTDYIDLLYVHWWDWSTSVEEVMDSLNQLVTSGKVLYLGISDTPAWIVSKANQYARDNNLRAFSVYQGNWNAAKRDMEREIIPMCHTEGMGIAPWGVLGQGRIRTAAAWAEIEKSGHDGRQNKPSDIDTAVSKVLEGLANKYSAPITSIAFAYVMHKYPYVSPIIGQRKVEHLKSNIEALGIALSPEEIKEIEGAYDFDWGFPMNFLFRGGQEPHAKHVAFTNATAKFDFPERPALSAKSLDA